MNTVEELKQTVDAGTPEQIDLLGRIVAIPSVGSDPAHADDLERSAEFVCEQFGSSALTRVSSAGRSPRVCLGPRQC